MEPIKKLQVVDKNTGESKGIYDLVFTPEQLEALQSVINGGASGGGTAQQPDEFYVNGVLTQPEGGIVTLAAQGKYVLSGVLNGRVVVGTADDVPTDDTHIMLAGVTITTTDERGCGIEYLPSAQSMQVTLANGRQNVIRCMHTAEIAEQQGAALYSENNMIVQGCGYLSVINKGGHGIKASELRLSGRPHIYASAVHDGIHGNSRLAIDGGYYYIDGANDAFGTGSTGSIRIVGGVYRAYNVRQAVFDSKEQGYFMTDVDVLTDAQTLSTGMAKVDARTYFGEAQVLSDGEPVTPLDGVYTCAGLEVVVSGYVDGRVETTTPKVEVTLAGAYIAGGLAYTGASSNMQVNALNDTFNVVHCGTGDAISSTNNLKVEAKGGSYLYVNSAVGNGISGSEITIHDSKGVIIVNAAYNAYGVTGTDIYIADSADHKTFDDEMVGGAVIVGTIHARLSGKGKKGNVTVSADNLTGILLADTISKASGSADTTGISLQQSQHIYYNKVEGDVMSGVPMPVSEPYKCLPLGAGALPIV